MESSPPERSPVALILLGIFIGWHYNGFPEQTIGCITESCSEKFYLNILGRFRMDMVKMLSIVKVASSIVKARM